MSYTDAPHNTITPILRRKGENYVFDLVLRNNRTDGGTPAGHFPPARADLHHIKTREHRPDRGHGAVHTALAGSRPSLRIAKAISPARSSWSARPRIRRFTSTTTGCANWPSATAPALPKRKRLALCIKSCPMCARRCSRDAGVYKQDEAGRAGLQRFLDTVGLTR